MAGGAEAGRSLPFRQFQKYYEQTQHVIENKESRFGEPSNLLKSNNLTLVTQQVYDNKIGYSYMGGQK